VAAEYYCANSENGDHVDAPSEDALFMLISDLNGTDNTFVVVQPDEDDPAWFASVAVLDEGGYEIVRRDTNAANTTSPPRPASTGSRATSLIGWPPALPSRSGRSLR